MDGQPHSDLDLARENEALIEFLYLTPVGIIKFRPDGTILMVNPKASQLLMPLAADMKMSNLYQLLSDLVPDLGQRIEDFDEPAGAIIEQMQLSAQGGAAVLKLSVNKINADTMMAVVQDITIVIEQERKIRHDQKRFQAILDNVQDYAIFTADPEGRVEEWNRSLTRLGGWEPTDVEGFPVDIFFQPGGLAEEPGMALLGRTRAGGRAEFEGWGVHRDGSAFWGNTVATVLPDDAGKPPGFVLITRDLSERKRTEDRLVTLATRDALTGALNRHGGDARLAEAFQMWQRHQHAFTVLMLDVDHFKDANDQYGHEAGDDVLGAIVRICKETLRGGDVIIRWGGDEFLILLPEIRGEIGELAAGRLCQAIEDAPLGKKGCFVTVSIGVADVMPGDGCAADVVNRADHALYSAKLNGRNQVNVAYLE